MARKPRKYHSLLALIDGVWGVQFGDYERAVVKDERAAYIDNGEAKAKELKIITTGDTQAEIMAEVDRLNGKGTA